MSEQLLLPFEKTDVIETVVIEVAKAMPLEVFKSLHHVAYFMELMERLPDGRIIWDESCESLYSEASAEAEYFAMQKGWVKIRMELPKKVVERLSK